MDKAEYVNEAMDIEQDLPTEPLWSRLHKCYRSFGKLALLLVLLQSQRERADSSIPQRARKRHSRLPTIRPKPGRTKSRTGAKKEWRSWL